jgi:hypothetical protein
MDDNSPQIQAPQRWIDALARSEAQVAAGDTVPSTVVWQHIQESLARLEARPVAKQSRKGRPNRKGKSAR